MLMWVRRYFGNWVRFPLKLTLAIQALSHYIFYPWSFYMWINVSRFGAQPECNDLFRFVLVFYTFQATVVWTRYLCTTILAITTFGLLCNLVIIFIVRKVHIVVKRSSAGSDIEKQSEDANENNWLRKMKRFRRLLINAAWALSILCVSLALSSRDNNIIPAHQVGCRGTHTELTVRFVSFRVGRCTYEWPLRPIVKTRTGW